MSVKRESRDVPGLVEHTPTRHRSKIQRLKWVLFPLGLVFLCSIACLASYRWARTPRYIDVAIPAPDGRWSYTERIVQTWEGSANQYALVRNETRVYDDSCGQDEDRITSESIVTYFDSQLAERGWIRHGDGPTVCEHHIPETRFLEHVTDSHIVLYGKHDPHDWAPHPEVCLAVWPADDGSGYMVILATRNPSWLAKLNYEYAHPRAQ